jgi:hypothetical protein
MTNTGRRCPLGLLALSLVAFSGVSCGGDGGSCPTPAACGGNLVGNWVVTSSCVQLTGTFASSLCPTATAVASLRYSGQVSYTASMTYDISSSAGGTEAIDVPASCVTTTCDQIAQALQASPPDGLTSIQCAPAAGGGCTCSAALAVQSNTETGTYTLSGTSITTTASGGGGETDSYCATANHLDINPDTGSPLSGITISGSIGLTRQ